MKLSKDQLLLLFNFGGANNKGLLEEDRSKLPTDITINHSKNTRDKLGVFCNTSILKGMLFGPLNHNSIHWDHSESSDMNKIWSISENWWWLKYIQTSSNGGNTEVIGICDRLYFKVKCNIAPGSEMLFSEDSTIVTPHILPQLCDSPSSSLMGSFQPICRLCSGVFDTFYELWSHLTAVHSPPSNFYNFLSSPHLLKPITRTPPETNIISTFVTQPLFLPPPTTPTVLPSTSPTSPENASDSPAHKNTLSPSSPSISTPTSQSLSNMLPLSLRLTKPYPIIPSRIKKEVLEKDVAVSINHRDTERPYECGHCGKSFSLPSSLRRHIITHTGERPYKCGYCGRAFAGATTLNNHIRIHTGEKPHICDDCGASFTQATQLNRHIRCCSKSTMDSHATSSRKQQTEIFVT